MNRTARVAGGLYLAVAILAAFGNLYVPSALVVRGDAETTASNIAASELLFRSGILSHLIGQVVFVFLVLTLYRLLEPVNKARAVLMVVLAIVGVPMAFLNEVNRLMVLRLLSDAPDGASSTVELQNQAMRCFATWESGIHVTLAFWGLWLVPLGLLVFRSGFLPRLLGILLVVSGAGYVTDAGMQLLFPGVPTVSQFTFAGEALFLLWLLIRGVRAERGQGVAHRGSHE